MSGFRRYAVAGELGIGEVPAVLVGGRPDRLLLSTVAENMSQSPALDWIERARVVVRMRELDCTEDRIIAQVLPLLELPAHRHQLRQLEFLDGLPETIRRAISGRLTHESARILNGWDRQDADFFIDLVDRFQLGTNKQKQLLELLEDLSRKEHCSPREIWSSSGADAIEQQTETAPSDRFQRFRQALHRRRFPVLNEYEDRADRLQRELALPREIQLRLPPNFEGDRLDVLLRVSSTAELRVLLERLEAAVRRPEMEELFQLL